MKAWQYFLVLLLGTACLGLSVAVVVTARSSQALQAEVQARQAQLSGGVLGPQAQQLASAVLRDMAGAAAGNEKLRQLLARHGYTVAPAGTPAEKGVTP